ncbi:twin-arginine translocase subunit TatC [Oceanisphaera profunda]|uniref:Sec-independent protein translocase protein TatC n=1 Tax=Oceanisphaera profunda TaxID=1416627 RepID=A0A1Y0D5B8_9GAMM|nr:twin-arginine translocase subunit TatC [Oceanisphaera profunda]ART82743.1 twin-arginine translocase subunit TatC [Oceanisphaera profunda]
MNQIHQPLFSHLVELRGRILRAFAAVLLVFLALVYFANDIYTILAEPLLRQLPEGGTMIATGVATPFLTPMKLTLIVSFFLAIPYVLYQVWAFIAPGLYKHEKRLITPLVFSSALLFYAGAAFAYFVVFPLAFGFFTKMAPEGVTIATDIASYLDFVLGLFIAFGIAFEIPIATIVICWTGMMTPKELAKKRPYVIVIVFLVGMLLTPPDVISQTLLAIPMWLLFEVGVFFARFYVRRPEDEEEQDSAS